ncbi:MAG: nucleic acid-binding protein [Gracilibacter sp. BRH_c7a]|nr:MAG: nucleic acid-binding protein [Gracilibacter sp. BRH_c7a]
MKKNKIPLRMCLGCQEMKPKKELLRIVKTPEGVLEFDLTSKKNGRGAYICSQQDCLTKAIKYKRFEKNFGIKLSNETLNEIERQLNSS